METETDQAAQTRWPTWADWLVFVLLAVFIAASNWPAISAANIEVGDFAANSLLIQDAKSFKLIYGNYSRVGFNHPGPAFLYVLAAGEVLFHDVLRLVSPLSGQLLAVALLSAAWLTGLLRIVRRSLQSSAGALLFVAVFMLSLALFDHDILSGLWFPHLYVLPFSVLVASAATLVQGRTDSILPLGISTGFLINGHVSFVAIVAIVLACVLVANRIATRGTPALRVSTAVFLRTHRRAVWLYIGIVLGFLVPFLIANLVEHPGPAQQYLAFSHGTQGNKLRLAARYVAAYWKGTAGWAALAALLLVIAVRNRLAPAPRAAVGALLAAMIGASLALLYYAKVGIDLLEFSYIGLFYVAVPGFALALAAWYCYWLVPAVRRLRTLAVLCALVALVICYGKIARPPEYAPQFRDARVIDLLKAVSALHPQGRIVLDVDNAANWGGNWVAILGMQAYAKRHGADPFCVGLNWHISFTRQAHCTAAELATAPRYYVHESSTAPAALGKPAVDQMGVALFPLVRPEPVGAGPVTLKDHPQDFGAYYLQNGWSTAEGDFVWSLGKSSGMAYALPAGFHGTLAIDAMAFLPKGDYVQNVEVMVDGAPAATVRFTNADNRKRFVIPVAGNGSGLVTIELRYPNAISPAQAHLSADPRVLALGLYGIELKRN